MCVVLPFSGPAAPEIFNCVSLSCMQDSRVCGCFFSVSVGGFFVSFSVVFWNTSLCRKVVYNLEQLAFRGDIHGCGGRW